MRATKLSERTDGPRRSAAAEVGAYHRCWRTSRSQLPRGLPDHMASTFLHGILEARQDHHRAALLLELPCVAFGGDRDQPTPGRELLGVCRALHREWEPGERCDGTPWVAAFARAASCSEPVRAVCTAEVPSQRELAPAVPRVVVSRTMPGRQPARRRR